MRRRLAPLLMALALAAALAPVVSGAALSASAVPAGASSPAAPKASPTTTLVPLPPPQAQAPSIIPLPNSGADPKVQGDRGSLTQYLVLFGTMGAMVLVAFLARRESQKNAAFKTPPPGPAPDRTPHPHVEADAP